MSQPPPEEPGIPPPAYPPPPSYAQPVYPPQGPPPFPVPPRRGMSPLALALVILAGCGVVGLIGVALLGAILFPVFAQAREAARAASCRSNVKQLSLALQMYAQDYDNRLPPAKAWLASTRVYTKNLQVEQCPSATGYGGYAFNAWMSGRDLSRVAVPSEQPLLFDSSSPGPQAADGLESFAPRHRQTGTIGFADGSVRALAAPPAPDAGLKPRR